MPMSPRLLRPIASGVHPEANAWRTAVVAAGGSVSATTMKAVSTFCGAIDAAGIRDRFYRLNLFCGNSDGSLFAVRTPLYRGQSRTGTQYGNALDTNNNFVQGDYAEGTGLTGNATTKYLQTGLSQATIGSMGHASFYKPNANAIASADRPMGAHDTVSSPNVIYGFRTSATDILGEWRLVGGPATIANTSSGLIAIDRDSDVSITLYDDGVSSATNALNAASAGGVALEAYIFNQNRNNAPIVNNYYAETLAGYSLGLSMTASQHAAYAAAMTVLQTAFGRNP